jgi:hypothetical protein
MNVKDIMLARKNPGKIRKFLRMQETSSAGQIDWWVV